MGLRMYREFIQLFLFAIVYLYNEVHSINFLNCECGIGNNIENRIVGGHDANPHQFPWLVAIENKGHLHCGGAIINDRYILTAGHCVNGKDRKNLNVTIASHNRGAGDGYRIPIKRILIHPDFYSYPTYDENDIALIKLKYRLKFNSAVWPVCLPKPNSVYFGQYGTVAGWGRVGEHLKSSEVLQEGLVKVLYPHECAATQMKQYMSDTVLCAFLRNTDACQGDSGGPLTFEREPGKSEQIGIVSWGIGCATPKTPGMYTFTEKYLKWIYENTMDAYYCMDY